LAACSAFRAVWLHWSTKIFPMTKNVCFWCIFGRWIQMCFQNFSITHTFC
jgi:hypothetical protein